MTAGRRPAPVKSPASAPAPAAPGVGAREAARDLGLYVHIPFCISRCHYCDFNTYLYDRSRAANYLEALRREIAGAPARPGLAGRRVRSIFFGGGTPSVLPPAELLGLLEAGAAAFPLIPGAEVTVEANPGVADAGNFGALCRGGFNRLSLGVQSFDDALLHRIGRNHTGREAREAHAAARGAGFSNINLDLIFALPGQTLNGWEATLRAAVTLGPEHLSTYGLTYEEGTRLWQERQRGHLPPADEETEAAMFEAAMAHLTAAGYEHYEVSSFARPGCRSVHNQLYWRNQDWLGFGAGSHSHLAGRRFHNLRRPEAYTSAILTRGEATAGEEAVPPAQQLAEALMLGLRLRDGVDLERLEAPFLPLGARVDRGRVDDLSRAGLLECTRNRVRLTPRGLLVADAVLVRLV